MIVFSATHAEKMIEEDHYEQGCIGGLTCNFSERIDTEASSLHELIQKLSKEFGLHEDLKYWFFDKENNHLFYSVLEDNDGVEIIGQSKDYELWKAGKIKGYNAEFRFFVEKNDVRRLPFDDNDCVGIDIM